MTDAKDARFEDADERPLRLNALDAEDLQVISSLTQDAVFPVGEMTYDRPQRRFAVLLNRYRWEYRGGKERVRSILTVENAMAVASQGVDRGDPDTLLSLLSIDVTPGEDGAGRVLLTLSGDGGVAVEVEALEVMLRDVTRPYDAPSKRTPGHPAD